MNYRSLLAAMHSGQTVEISIPLQGSLELLAMGDIGLAAWRHARQVYYDQQKMAVSNAKKREIKNDKPDEPG